MCYLTGALYLHKLCGASNLYVKILKKKICVFVKKSCS